MLLQFYQFGIESFGIGHPVADVEAIAFAHRFLTTLNLEGAFSVRGLVVAPYCLLREMQLELSSLGDTETRANFRTVLKDFFEGHKATLSPEGQARLERGSVLRILDSKEATDQPLLQQAPRIDAYYTPAARERFLEVQEGRQVNSTYGN